MNTEPTRDKIHGMFLGIAIGDALFMPVETMKAEEITERHGKITNYLRPDGHKWFDGREAGTWTDDTQLTLAMAESLIACKEMNMDDIAARHVASMQREGDLGFGGSTRDAIQQLAQGIYWSQSGITEKPKRGVGNGIPMKIAPIGAYHASPYYRNQKEDGFFFLEKIAQCVFMTHRTQLALDSASAHIAAIQYCLRTKSNMFSLWQFIETIRTSIAFEYPFKIGVQNEHTLQERLLMLRAIPLEKMEAKDFMKLFGGGTSYVYNSLPFSYAFFLKNPQSIETLYDVGNAGGDTDTNASIVGGLLGALNGTAIFPPHLCDGLWQKERILNTAERFCDTFGIRA
ncbi:MAG: ADP-ribosylglycohydrolase family protein [bacterium]|nr:ADP-ribosylglycohydrolase family protein [bacterium]